MKLAFFESKLIFEDSQEIIVLFSVIMPSKYYVWIIFVEAKRWLAKIFNHSSE